MTNPIPSINPIGRVLDDVSLPPIDRLMSRKLIQCSRHPGVVGYSTARIAATLGVRRRTAQLSLARLIDAGLVSRVRDDRDVSRCQLVVAPVLLSAPAPERAEAAR